MDSNWQVGETLSSREKADILKALRFFDGNKTKTAQALGIAIRTLDHRLEEYEVKANGESKGLPREASGPQTSQSNGSSAKIGNGLEPASQAPEKRSVSMRKREKV